MTTWQPGYGDVGLRGILSSLDDFCGNNINLCGSQLTATIWGMVAGISAIGAPGSASQRLLGRLETAEESTPAVIGEGMSSRVIPYAEAHGYVYYSGIENPENFTAEERLAHNLAQVEAWKAEGRPVIDIGPEPGREFYPMATSANYAMEQNSLRGYAGYSTDILPGEADWWIASAP